MCSSARPSPTAAWSSSGSGSGTAQSTTSEDSTITADVFAHDLYPGATKSVTITIDDPKDYPVLVTSISAGSADVVNVSCVAGTVTSDAHALDATGLVQSDNSTKQIAAGDDAEFTIVTHMSSSAVDACKSQTFDLPLTATLKSA